MDEKINQLYTIYERNPIISTDSRKITPGSVFFALKGDIFNGVDFAMEALQKGAAFAVVEKDFPIHDKRLLRVKNVLNTLQNLASFHRQKLGLPVLAITGSNGKTTTKELIQRVLSKRFHSFSTQGNLNNHIGVPLTLLSLSANHDMAVVEMGANHINEIAALCQIAQPDFGLITNVGKAHLEGFGSFKGVIKAKTEMYQFLREKGGQIFINSGNKYLMKAAHGLKSVTYGIQNAQITGNIISANPYLSIGCMIDNRHYTINTRLIGKYNFENVLAAVAVGNFFKISPEVLIDEIESYEPANNRSQIITTSANTLIMDAYNANPSSMKASIENFIESDFQKKVLILGDMAELGKDAEKEHLAMLSIVKKIDFYDIIIVGPIFNSMNKMKFKCFPSVDSLKEHLKMQPFIDCTILLKASRKMQLEKLMDVL